MEIKRFDGGVGEKIEIIFLFLLDPKDGWNFDAFHYGTAGNIER